MANKTLGHGHADHFGGTPEVSGCDVGVHAGQY